MAYNVQHLRRAARLIERLSNNKAGGMERQPFVNPITSALQMLLLAVVARGLKSSRPIFSLVVSQRHRKKVSLSSLR